MNFLRTISLLFIATCCLYLCGCNDSGTSNVTKGDSGTSNVAKGESGTSNVGKLEAKKTKEIIREKDKKIKTLEEENREIREERDKAVSLAKKRHNTLSIIGYTALGTAILLIGWIVFMIQVPKRNPTVTSNDSLYCPRCGWEHRPEETVCKNCRTHF